MEKTLTIKTLQTKEIDTKFGKRSVMNVSFHEKDRFWADVFCADWNNDWAVNKEVKIYDSQWKKRTYTKKDGTEGIGWNITPPPPVSREEFDKLLARVEALEKTPADAPKSSQESVFDEEGSIIPDEPEGEAEDEIINSIPF